MFNGYIYIKYAIDNSVLSKIEYALGHPHYYVIYIARTVSSVQVTAAFISIYFILYCMIVCEIIKTFIIYTLHIIDII